MTAPQYVTVTGALKVTRLYSQVNHLLFQENGADLTKPILYLESSPLSYPRSILISLATKLMLTVSLL